jgi:uncharacterized protein (DUF302 family)
MSRPIVRMVSGDVGSVVSAVTRELDARGIRVFATIDHAGGAREVGLELADEVVIVFGNPAVGTGLMQDDPVAGLDLPLRMLVWDAGDHVGVAYHDPRELAERYGIGAHAEVLERLAELIASLTTALT